MKRRNQALAEAETEPNSRTHGRRWAAAAIAGLVLSAAPPTAASAADFELLLPAGTACEFELRVTGTGGPETREFTDRDGNVVRTLTAGRGAELTFENVDTGETVELAANGSVISEMLNPDGSMSVRSTGHTVLILFPSDVPAGPSTTLYTGRVTYDVDTQQVFTLTGVAGRTRDLCAELD
ncbi:hypothetical protein ACFT30_01330 [Microbacterium ureisolvens]|uniref:hypothetical protein n=1 Tax=Microbacterium ureisolvens TaxID=2781186 RepID=UPI003645E1B9